MGNGKLTLVLGNGFDLNLGLKTSYKNFLESKEFLNGFENGEYKRNSIFYHLRQLKQLNNWIDVEKELKEYYKSTHSPEFNSLEDYEGDFNNLVENLTNYLKSQKCEDLEEQVILNSYSYKLLKQVLDSNLEIKILNFNYTNAVAYLLKNYFAKDQIYINSYLKHVHGTLEYNNIIVGVDESFKPERVNNFIRKFSNIKYENTDVNRILNDSNVVIFFGHSLGETDHSYFDRFFEKYSIPDLLTEPKKPVSHLKHIYLFYFGKSDWYNKDFELINLTKSNLKSLMDNCVFQKINYDCEIIDLKISSLNFQKYNWYAV